MTIRYVPGDTLLELKSLRDYLTGFRNRSILQEIAGLLQQTGPTIRVGDYVQVSGEKVNEQLYTADEVTVTH